jgi:hypothetical protein
LKKRFVVLGILLFLVIPKVSVAQVEPVESGHGVYEYLTRMEVRQILPSYQGTVTPISRAKIAEYLSYINNRRHELSRTERDLLDSFRIEFMYDMQNDITNSTRLFDTNGISGTFRGFPDHKQRYIYAYYDTSGTSLFLNSVISVEHRSRSISGDIDENNDLGLTIVDFGGTIRGSIHRRLGYLIEVRNAYGGGDREIAREIGRLWHSRDYRTEWEDFAEYSRVAVRYQAGIVGIELARDRILWRESYSNSLFLSDNAPMFNALRVDLSYKSVSYNYVHGAVLWYNYRQREDQKYFVANRFEFSLLRNLLSIGINQSTMYSRSAPEIGYLIPFNILEATERNLGDRDASMIGMDITVRPVRNLELKTGGYFDDIRFDESFTSSRRNMWSAHAGLFYTNVLGWSDTDFKINYTRIEPYVYNHSREPHLHYEHDGFLMGHPLGPNSDEWYSSFEYRPSWQWRLSLEFLRQRHGDNVLDEQGNVIRNVGGDVFFSHRRDIDLDTKIFLDGVLTERNIGRLNIRYEIFRQFIFYLSAEWRDTKQDNRSWQEVTLSGGFWLEI